MMKNTLLSLATLAFAALVATSCVSTPQLYSWYGYEDAVYNNYKKPTDKSQEHVLQQYRAVIEKQKGTRATVPPGLYAEYFMKQEKALYPESDAYISRIIKQLEK